MEGAVCPPSAALLGAHLDQEVCPSDPIAIGPPEEVVPVEGLKDAAARGSSSR